MTRFMIRTALGIAMLSPAIAQAQVAPPAGNIEERSRQQIRVPEAPDGDDALVTGDSDIILLRKTRLFNLHASASINVTDNAYLSPGPRIRDGFGQIQTGVGFATKIAGRINVVADASVLTVRYFDETALDYSAVAGVVGVGTNFGKLNLSATYQPSVVFTRDFESRQVTSHRFRLSASAGFRLRGLSIEPEIHGERSISDPSEYSVWSGGGSVTLSAQPLAKVPLLLFVQAGYDRRSFDDYFEAFVGVKREDDNFGAGAGVVWRPNAWADIRASYSFGRNWSTSDVSRYRAHSGTLGINASIRF